MALNVLAQFLLLSPTVPPYPIALLNFSVARQVTHAFPIAGHWSIVDSPVFIYDPIY
jgi:hypothetical protein